MPIATELLRRAQSSLERVSQRAFGSERSLPRLGAIPPKAQLGERLATRDALELERSPRPQAKPAVALEPPTSFGSLAQTFLHQTYQAQASPEIADRFLSVLKRDLGARPVRKLDTPVVADYLRQHPVYVSLTTSPTRIASAHHVLDTLDLTHVKEVLVALPEKYGRDGTTYEIPDALTRHPKVRVLRPSKDLGPATKLIPAAEYALAQHKDPLVITVDDDIGYPKGMVNELIFASAHNPGRAFGGSGANFETWHIEGRASEGREARSGAEGAKLTVQAVDVIEGFGAVAYPAARLNIDQIKAWSARSKDCLLSDDLVISMSLRTSSVERMRVSSAFLNKAGLRPFPYGLGADALHNGGGKSDASAPVQQVDVNAQKYQRAFAQLQSEIKE